MVTLRWVASAPPLSPFKAAYGLVRKEYIFETDAVVRLILEQLAWAYAVYSAPDNDVFKVSPTKCITRLIVHDNSTTLPPDHRPSIKSRRHELLLGSRYP
jgi:hypothetical protein